MDAKEQVRKRRIEGLEAEERDLLAKRRVIEQRKLTLKTHRVPPGDRAWVEAERALVGNQQSLTDLRGELTKARQLT